MSTSINLGATVVLASLLLTAPAMAYERTQTCTPSGVTACKDGEVPQGIFWPTRRVEYVLEATGSPDFGAALTPALRAGIQESFDAWNTPTCSDIQFVEAGTSTRSEVGISCTEDGEDQSINLLLWPDEWDKASSIFALTSVTYNVLDGVIVDADIEFNEEYSYTLSTTPGPEEVSVQNTLTHEVGHFLGLDHEPDIAQATMFGFAPEGEYIKATLHPDDIAGLCEIYPAGTGTVLESTQNICPQNTGCCAQVTGTSPTQAPFVWGAALLFGLMGLRRRRS